MAKNKQSPEELAKVLQRIVAAAGGNAQQVQLPATKRPIAIQYKRVGPNHVLIAHPSEPRSRRKVADKEPEPRVHYPEGALRGHVITVEDSNQVWLLLDQRVPVLLIPANAEAEVKMLTLATMEENIPALATGAFSPQGFVVYDLCQVSEESSPSPQNPSTSDMLAAVLRSLTTEERQRVLASARGKTSA